MAWKRLPKGPDGFPSVLRKHRGAHSELLACAWLVARGCEVFRNLSPHGIVDIVVLWRGRLIAFDAKTTAEYMTKDGLQVAFPRATEEQAANGVQIIYVRRDGSIVCPFFDGAAAEEGGD